MSYLISVLNVNTSYMSSCVYEYICIFATLYRDTYSLPRVSCMEHSICLTVNVFFFINTYVCSAFFIHNMPPVVLLFCFAYSTLKTYKAVICYVCMILTFPKRYVL